CSGYGLTGAFDQLVVSSGIWPGADPQSADIHAFRWRNGGNLAASLLDGNAGVSYYRCWNTLVSLSHHDLSSGYQIVGYGLAGDLELSAEEILLPPGIHHRLQTGASQRYPNAAQPERMSSTVPDYHPDLLSVCHSLPDGYGRAFGIGGKSDHMTRWGIVVVDTGIGKEKSIVQCQDHSRDASHDLVRLPEDQLHLSRVFFVLASQRYGQ